MNRSQTQALLTWKAILAAPAFWSVLFIAVPALLILAASFTDMASLERLVRGAAGAPNLRTDAFGLIAGEELYHRAIVSSLLLATTSSAFTLAIGYPIALAIARSRSRWRPILLVVVALPFLTSFLIRIYSWMTILSDNGVLNGMLVNAGLIDTPIHFLNSMIAVHIGIAYTYLPFMVFPIYAALQQQDRSVTEAAADLGARPLVQFAYVTLPLSLPGVVAGVALVFVPVLGEYVIPELLGPPDALTLGRMIWTDFFRNRDWPVAAATAVTLGLAVWAINALSEAIRQRSQNHA